MSKRYDDEFKDWAILQMMPPLNAQWQTLPLRTISRHSHGVTGEGSGISSRAGSTPVSSAISDARLGRSYNRGQSA